MIGDVMVYEAPGGKDYVMHVDEAMNGWQPGWWRWPAEQHGWTQRKRMPEPGTDTLLSWHELPPKNAVLALRLSGADRG
jgi:hypothetical protein